MFMNCGRLMRPFLAPSTSFSTSLSSATDSSGSSACSSSRSSSPLLSVSTAEKRSSTISRQSSRFWTVSQLSREASRSSNFMSGQVKLVGPSPSRKSAAHSSGSVSSWLAISHTSASVRWLPPCCTSSLSPCRNCVKVTESWVPPSSVNNSRRCMTCGSLELEMRPASFRSRVFLSTLKVPNICRRRTTSELSVSSCLALASPPSRTHGFCRACTAVGRFRGSFWSRLATKSLAPWLTNFQSPLSRSSASPLTLANTSSMS
mmetsp:Transcript_43363/g.110949  ORF Transcript_43363/g.110949 Transcript_43363/m.110949 type:complete len:261 (-) Transcript_43363:988-1770(-)